MANKGVKFGYPHQGFAAQKIIAVVCRVERVRRTELLDSTARSLCACNRAVGCIRDINNESFKQIAKALGVSGHSSTAYRYSRWCQMPKWWRDEYLQFIQCELLNSEPEPPLKLNLLCPTIALHHVIDLLDNAHIRISTAVKALRSIAEACDKILEGTRR